MMAARAITVALAGRKMVDLAVAPRGAAGFSRATILGATFGGGARETPDVFSLPSSAAFVGAPCAATDATYLGVAPLAHADLADPLREIADNSAGLERRARFALSGHGQVPLCATSCLLL